MIAPMIAPIGRVSVACSVINLSLSHDRSHDRSAVIEADQSKMDQVHGGRGDYIRGTGGLGEFSIKEKGNFYTRYHRGPSPDAPRSSVASRLSGCVLRYLSRHTHSTTAVGRGPARIRRSRSCTSLPSSDWDLLPAYSCFGSRMVTREWRAARDPAEHGTKGE